MSKINNKVLFVILLVLAGAYFANKYFSNKDTRNFRSVLVSLDTARVDKILLTFPPTKGNPITIEKVAPGEYKVTHDGISDEADQGIVKSMLSSHLEMKPERLVANSESLWGQYEVTDSAGVNVKMYAGGDLLSEIIIGKFDFQQATRTMNTMVRLAEEDEVYAVDGFLSSVFNVEFNAVRDKTFVRADKNSVTTVKAEYPADSSFSLTRNNGKWFIEGQPADSSQSVSFLNGLSFMNLRDFVNDFEGNAYQPLYTLTLEGDSINQIVINCYKPGEEYILHSSQNEGAYFKPGTNNIFEKLFPPREKFFVEEE